MAGLLGAGTRASAASSAVAAADSVRGGCEAGAESFGQGPTIEDLLIEGLLKVRNKSKGLVRLRPNRAQVEYSRRLHQDRTSC